MLIRIKYLGRAKNETKLKERMPLFYSEDNEYLINFGVIKESIKEHENLEEVQIKEINFLG